jgi:hypothetical protein
MKKYRKPTEKKEEAKLEPHKENEVKPTVEAVKIEKPIEILKEEKAPAVSPEKPCIKDIQIHLAEPPKEEKKEVHENKVDVPLVKNTEESPKVEVKEEHKVEVKEESKVEIKEEPKVEIKEEPKVEIKEEPKIEVKEEVKDEVIKTKGVAPEPANEEKAENSPIKVEGEEAKDTEESPQGREEGDEEEKGVDIAQIETVKESHEKIDNSAKIKALIDGIKQKFAETGQMYEDPDFPASDVSLYKDSTNLPEYTKDCPIVDWKRPQELVAVIIKN